MDLLERLKNIMERDFGITTDEQLVQELERLQEVDFGIFIAPVKEAAKGA